MIRPLSPEDFPLVANGQFVYRRTESSPIIGPVSMELAADLARRLNRDARVLRVSDLPKMQSGEAINVWPASLD